MPDYCPTCNIYIDEGYRQCPNCLKIIQEDLTICPNCNVDLIEREHPEVINSKILLISSIIIAFLILYFEKISYTLPLFYIELVIISIILYFTL